MAVELTREDYRRLRGAATTARKRLVVRLVAEVGVRPAEVVRIRPADVDRRRFDGRVHHFLSVREADGDPDRRAYLPEDVAGAIDEYAATTGTDPDEPLVDLSPRRVQMLVAEVSEAAADRTGDDRLADVSSGDLRRYFARRLLTEEGVDPRVVQSVGGWEGLAALDSYVDSVGDTAVAAAFSDGDRSPSEAASPFRNAVGAAALELDADGRVVECSGAVDTLLDRPAAAVAGDSFATLFTEAARERGRPRELLSDAGRDDVAVAECWFDCGDDTGRRLPTLVCVRRENGGLSGFSVVIRSAEADRRLAAGAFQRAIETAGQPMCLASVTGEIEYANAAFEELTGYTQGEALGRTADELLSSGENADAFYAELRETVLDGQLWRGQLTTRRKSGERVHVRQTIAPVTDEDGEVSFVVGVSTDITERIRRERALARRCETLEGLEALVADINAAGRELIDASTREEIEAAVCESLADSDAYVGAWAGATDPGDPRIRPTEWAGLSGEGGAVTVETAAIEEAMDGETPRVVGGEFPDDVLGPFDRSALADVRSAGIVPLAYGETTYGVLVVFTDRPTAFGDRERTLLDDLGDRIGHAVTAIERRTLLLADTVVELEFGCTDDGAFLVSATREHDCACTLEAVVPVSETALLFYVTLTDAPPDPFLDAAMAADGVVDARYIREYDDRSLLEFTVEGNSPALTLTERGATIRSAVVESGEATLSAEIARETDVRSVVEGLQAEFPETDLRAKQAVDQPVETVAEFQDSLAEKLTDKQRAALRAAYFAGYFDWPRGSTAEEVADSMGVSSPTLHNHLRKAERKLLSSFFEHTRDHIGAEVPRSG